MIGLSSNEIVCNDVENSQISGGGQQCEFTFILNLICPRRWIHRQSNKFAVALICTSALGLNVINIALINHPLRTKKWSPKKVL